MKNKFEKLQKFLKTLKKQGICLAFSGGIDSALLLYLCAKADSKVPESKTKTQGQNTCTSRIIAITFKSEFQTEEEINFTKKFCKDIGINQKIIEFSILDNNIIQNNPKDRCYHCKKLFFGKIKEFAASNGFQNIIDGTNFDDLSAYRPGLKAISELEIISPFAEFKITKSEIREQAKLLGLEIFDKPSTPCIATRFPYNTHLNPNDIEKVKSGERFLKSFGFENCRLRLHTNIARIEISQEKFGDFLNRKTEILEKLKPLGFKYVTLDISGLKSGSMDI